MKNYNITTLLFLSIAIACIVSCKKKNGAAPFSDQRIATVDYTHSGAILHYRIVYDRYNNVDSIIFTGDGTAVGNNGYKKFSYFGSSYSITDGFSNSFIVEANTSGMILKIKTADTLIMYYKNNQLERLDTKTYKITYPYYTLTSIYYNWSNGDVESVGPAGTGSDSKAYYYDLSKSGQPGDVFRVSDFLAYGRSYIKTVHLPKGLVGTDTTEKYFYQFDSRGRISQFIKVLPQTNDTAAYNYLYY